ncbi:site-2 protease family protein [Microbulbifer sp. ZKSA006]|uniref:site-2 protease family protein n=1 Tax=Microbulbifer sp. ZKSA006 TaxID=3243390 RepID=UPI0040396A80
MIELLISIKIFMILHISTIAAFLVLFGVKIKELSYGVGPTLLSIDKLKIQPIPISGYVRTLDSREDTLNEEEKRYTLDGQPLGVQVFLPLSGCIVVFFISYLFLGRDSLNLFVSAFQEIILGGLNPLSTGQDLIQRSRDFIQQSSLISIIATVQIKLVAFNLLPLTVLNGGQAIVNLIKMGKPEASWEIKAANISFILAMYLYVSWSFAMIYYVW